MGITFNFGNKIYHNILPESAPSGKQLVLLIIFCLSFLQAGNAHATEAEAIDQEYLTDLITKAEKKYDIPLGLLYSIAKVESGLKPYALNIEGVTKKTRSIQEAKEIMDEYLKAGVTNIDVGIMQLNYGWHGKDFSSINELLEPKTNIGYAARLLRSLYRQHGNWHSAIRYYHSATPAHHKKYSRKVVMAWISR